MCDQRNNRLTDGAEWRVQAGSHVGGHTWSDLYERLVPQNPGKMATLHKSIQLLFESFGLSNMLKLIAIVTGLGGWGFSEMITVLGWICEASCRTG